MRKPLIVGNWKMNNTLQESLSLIEGLISNRLSVDRDFVVCPPYTVLSLAGKLLKETKIQLGAQNMHFEEKGAYTGEVSALMLKELDVSYVIIGHSERRKFFGETDLQISKKIFTALNNELLPIMCVGESLAQREGDYHHRIIKKQLVEGLKLVDSSRASDVTVAYEPVWAIGTGKTATSEQANDMLGFIRTILINLYGESMAENIRILYGGSVNSSNVDELMIQPEIDGVLVGGASLKSDEFLKIMTYSDRG
ncbi:MAG: Triosephosphate isomerase [Clostridiales bacterium 38_11]|nr:MAG: Triosephosphate isomerase [Clostridiales bacterium 38_11]HBH13140.1 triose-phosphate isomerase [Clostridiales bacterium]